jgi:hypothetical protein
MNQLVAWTHYEKTIWEMIYAEAHKGTTLL